MKHYRSPLFGIFSASYLIWYCWQDDFLVSIGLVCAGMCIGMLPEDLLRSWAEKNGLEKTWKRKVNP